MSRTGYQFRVVEWPIHGDAWELEEKLNRHGKDGWQIVGMHLRDNVSPTYEVKTVLMVFLQRPLYEAPLMPGGSMNRNIFMPALTILVLALLIYALFNCMGLTQ